LSHQPTKPVGINLTDDLASRTAQLQAVMQGKVTGVNAKEVWNFATAFILMSHKTPSMSVWGQARHQSAVRRVNKILSNN
jgi:hypothetical protein